jgi:hypothetical protein
LIDGSCGRSGIGSQWIRKEQVSLGIEIEVVADAQVRNPRETIGLTAREISLACSTSQDQARRAVVGQKNTP